MFPHPDTPISTRRPSIGKLKRRRRILQRALEQTKDLPLASYENLRKHLRTLRDAIRARLAKLEDRLDRAQSQHRIIPRSAWNARPPKDRNPMANENSGLFVHHTVAASPTTEAAERAEMRNLQNFHMDGRGYLDLAYSFVVAHPSGRVYEGRGVDVAGAHTEGYNSTAYGVAVMGNFEGDTPTPAVIDSLRWLRRDYLRLGDRPVRGHRDVNPTACPGRNLYARLSDL